ncbi:unnamed protein product [Fraxinus pennsylvanica]|uniref:Integrase catalytic domain-containing protein n=1 Tax=Fraxinus pennsylvanica TaxID=56036 RepID=A0AAD2E1M2_9LAMI|nr:unnamed protein product [Fraxinus pennsylvanica]
MVEVHEGICGAHQVGQMMRWLIIRSGYFWPKMGESCAQYAKSCLACQKHGLIQRASTREMTPIIKPWPFKGWAIDLIGKIYPPFSKQHTFIIVATDFFTKWVEAIPLKEITQKSVIEFIRDHIIYRFGILQTLMVDHRIFLNGDQVKEFLSEFGVKLVNSTPYYFQSNGQAESFNKILKNIIRKMIDENVRNWHECLYKALWAYRTSPRSSTKVTPFQLTYGLEAVLPIEINVQSIRVCLQHKLSDGEYTESLVQNLLELDELKLDVLDRLQVQKQRMTKFYNKKVIAKSFSLGELVWKTILHLDSKDPKYGKWSPNWK